MSKLSTILLLILSISFSAFSQEAAVNASGYIYIKPLEKHQKEYLEVENIVYYKIYVDNNLVVATNNIENLQNYIPVESYNEWSSKNKREVKVVYTLKDGSELVYSSIKENSNILSQNIYFLN